MSNEQFMKYPTILFEATKISSRHGAVDVDHNIKAVYLYMLLRSEFFSQIGASYYENQDVIAENCGLSRRTIIRIIQKLQEINLIEVFKIRLRNGAVSNNYTVHRVDHVDWWYGDAPEQVKEQDDLCVNTHEVIRQIVDVAKRTFKGDYAYIISNEFLKSHNWKRVRMAALTQYGNQCMCCGVSPHEGAKICVDHIKPRLTNPELALDISNLQVLCEDCNCGKGNWNNMDFRLPW